MKRTIFTTLFAYLFFTSFAQKENKAVEIYKKEIDNPNVEFMGIGGHILSLQFDQFNAPIKVGVEAYAKIGELFVNTKGMFGEALIDVYSERSSTIYSAYEGGNAFSNYEATISYGLTSKNIIEKTQVNLFRSGNTIYYVDVPTTIKKTIGVEAALDRGFISFSGRANRMEGKPVLPESYEGTVNLGDTFGQKFMSTNYQYQVLSVGVNQTKTSYVLVNAKKYGTHSASSYLRYYGRLSFLVGYELDDVIAPGPDDDSPGGSNPVGYYKFSLKGNTPMHKIGFNAGVQLISPQGVSGIFFAEAGVLPGPQSGILGRAYINFGGGFSLSKLLFKDKL
ncbi:MAG: hypothetical protein N4A35_06130 [Flavobacteriales bacterium]|jgi:hypothetical protein|nr:hypothetical protein [Flavobacteriales bacterium]